ncbi:MAG: amino acid adenylation domain-containing protein [Methylovulum sp.]|nr:amino acid adenylation domain-containing protein [Methylovulum sp.]
MNFSQPQDVDSYLFPASFAQQRLWFFERLMGVNGIYNIILATRLIGELVVPALQQSLDAIVARHEALRTGFGEQDGNTIQVIRPTLSVACTRLELPAYRQDEVQGILEAQANQAFDLKQPPLIRALLVTLSGQGSHILLITVHHSVFDGWSIAVFNKELAHFYHAFSQGPAAALPKLPIQYADYAVWQREWLQGEMLDKQLAYWQRQLSGLSVLELPTDRPRPKRPSHRGGQVPIRLSAELAQGLDRLAHHHHATLFMVLLAGLQTLLHRYSGQTDIAIGTAIAGRNREELQGLIGFFVNTLVLRGDLSDHPDFCQLLGQARKTCLEAYGHQDIPFEKLVAEVQSGRDTGRHPLFQVMLVLQPPPVLNPPWPGLAMEPLAVAHHFAKFDLIVSLTEYPDGLAGEVEYSADLFDAATIVRMVGHFQTLLAAIVRQPETAIAELELLTDSERKQLSGWNATTTAYPHNQCVHQLFETQAAKTPEAIALVFEGQQLSYQELNTKANQLAHYLASLTGKPDLLIGVCLPRSPAMIITVLAILKAGGGYVPLDPAYPKERLKCMLADANVPVLITHTGQRDSLPETDALIVCADTLEETLNAFGTDNPAAIATPENLAYVLYTSGSTGIPKGVAMPHRALVNLLNWQTDGFKPAPDRRILQFTSLSFDVSFQEIFTALTTGGALVLILEEQRRYPPVLLNSIAQQKITDLFIPFIALQQLAQAHANTAIANHLNVIITAGEALHITPAIKRFMESLGGCQLVNQYGPTECHVVTAFNLPKDISAWAEFPSIGQPIANTQIYILDKQLQPVPIGVIGEIYIGGDSLARGYLNQAELTAEKFISHPFSTDPAARLYKTGDLARYLPDGGITFLGRMDKQIKLRGFRIELGEIEAVLGQYPSVNDVVVLIREDLPGDKRLVAYLTCPPQAQPDINALRGHVKAKLPDYMVPSAFVFLESLPLTPNGKLDRDALPVPEPSRPELAQLYAPPRTPVEEVLAAIWREVLGVAQVGIHDSFLDLGGDSILAMQLLARIDSHFQMGFPLDLLFEEPTIAGLSGQLEILLKQASPGKRLPIRALRRQPYKLDYL